MSIGGSAYGDPVLVKHSDGHLEVFVVGLDGHVWRKPQSGPGQPFVPDWTRMAINFHVCPAYDEEVVFDPLTTRIRSAIHQNGATYVFARSARGRIFYTHTGVPGGYSEWKSISAMQDNHPPLGNPTVASALTNNDSIQLCVRAKNGNVLMKNLDNTDDDWGDPNVWRNFSGTVSGEPVVGKSLNGSTRFTSIYARGVDNTLYWVGESVVSGSARSGGAHGVPYGAWTQLFSESFADAKLTGEPAMTSPEGGVLWRGINGNIWTLTQHAFGSFNGPVDLHLASAGDPLWVISGRDSYLFWPSPDGHLMMQHTPHGPGPRHPVSLTSTLPVKLYGKPSASTAPDGRVEIVFLGSDSAVYHLWETAVGSGRFNEGA